MHTFIALLRGINVGGQKRIRMTELKTLFQCLDLSKVNTYLQSGNIIFDSPEGNRDILSGIIEDKISQTFGLSIVVLLRTPDELNRVIASNPFLKESGIDIGKLYITFLAKIPTDSDLVHIVGIHSKLDRFVVAGNEIYLYCPGGYGRTNLSNEYFERKLGIKATTRNWQTVNTLAEIVGQ